MNDEISINYEQENQPKKKGLKGCLISIITMIVVAIIVMICIVIFGANKATYQDVNIYDNEQTLTSYTFKFKPKRTIRDLQFEIAFYDSNKNYKSSIKKNVGDVQKGRTYTVTINITELSIEQAFSDYIEIKISDGKTSLF